MLERLKERLRHGTPGPIAQEAGCAVVSVVRFGNEVEGDGSLDVAVPSQWKRNHQLLTVHKQR